MNLQRRRTNEISYLHREGTGVPLVLLHGIGSNAESFAPLIKALPPRLPVLAWDAPGYGESLPLTTDWPDTSDYASQLLHLLDTLRIERFALAGHSLATPGVL